MNVSKVRSIIIRLNKIAEELSAEELEDEAGELEGVVDSLEDAIIDETEETE